LSSFNYIFYKWWWGLNWSTINCKDSKMGILIFFLIIKLWVFFFCGIIILTYEFQFKYFQGQSCNQKKDLSNVILHIPFGSHLNPSIGCLNGLLVWIRMVISCALDLKIGNVSYIWISCFQNLSKKCIIQRQLLILQTLFQIFKTPWDFNFKTGVLGWIHSCTCECV
jgi:hypothetical protein